MCLPQWVLQIPILAVLIEDLPQELVVQTKMQSTIEHPKKQVRVWMDLYCTFMIFDYIHVYIYILIYVYFSCASPVHWQFLAPTSRNGSEALARSLRGAWNPRGTRTPGWVIHHIPWSNGRFMAWQDADEVTIKKAYRTLVSWGRGRFGWDQHGSATVKEMSGEIRGCTVCSHHFLMNWTISYHWQVPRWTCGYARTTLVFVQSFCTNPCAISASDANDTP